MANSFDKIEVGNYYHIYNRGINSCALFESEVDYQRFLLLYEKYITPIADTIAWVLMPNHFHFLIRIKENVRYKYSMEEIAKAKINAVRSEDVDRLSADNIQINKWATETLPDGVKDPSALRGNDINKALTLSGISTQTGCGMNGTSTQTGCGMNGTSTQKGFSYNVRVPNPAKHLSHLFNAYAKYYNTRYNRHGALFERPYRRKQVDSDNYFRQLIIYIHNNPRHHGFVHSALEYGWSSYLDYLSAGNEIYSSCVNEYFGDINNFKACHQSVDFDEDYLE